MWDDIGIPQNRFCRHRWKKQKHLLIHISIYIYIIYLYVYLYIHTSIHLYIYAHAQVALPTAPPWQSISAFPAQVPGKRCHLLPAACVAGEPRGYLEANHKIKGCGYLIYIYGIIIYIYGIYIYMDRPMYIYSPVWSARAGSTSNTCQRQQRSTWKETIWQEHFKNGLAWTGSAVSPLPSATVAAGSFPDRLWDEKAN